MTSFRKPHVYRDPYGHIIIDGHTFMGRNRVPPMPNRIALTDRVTGDVKVLSHTPGAGALELVDVNPSWTDVTVYGATQEPWYFDGTTHWRIYLSNGNLNAAASGTGGSSGRILTRRAFETTVLELTVDPDGTIVYTQIDL